MSPAEFAALNLDLVLKFSVGSEADTRGVILTLDHLSLPAARGQQRAEKTSVLLTLDQAEELSTLLAKMRHTVGRPNKHDA
jgi:hypothetical protein